MIEIITLGGFSIKINGEEITDKYKRTTKLWKFLSLLIINRGKSLPVSVILDSVWPEEDSDASGKSLHNLVYRLRKLLGDGASHCIHFRNNCYSLASGEGLFVDVYALEDYFAVAMDPGQLPDTRAELLRKAVALYGGEYTLNAFDNDVWAIPAVNNYRRIFSDALCALADLYYESEEYDKLIPLCRKGTLIEPLEEAFYERLVRGLRAKGQEMHAITVCESYINMLKRELGAQASESFLSLYHELKGSTLQLRRDMDHALKELREFEAATRAKLCTFEAFKDVYRYESRCAKRHGTTLYLLLISISDGADGILPLSVLGAAMRNLHESCMTAMRKCDVVADYSRTQVIAMLNNTEAQQVGVVISRIENQFRSRSHSKGVKILFDVQSGLEEKAK